MSSSTSHPLAPLHSNPLYPLQDRRAISAAHRSSFSNSADSENSSPMSNVNPADILRRRLSLSSPKPSHILSGPEKQQFRQRFPPTPLPEVLQTPSAFTGLFGRTGEMGETSGSKESREMRDRRGSGADYFSDVSIDSEAIVEDIEDDDMMPNKEANSGNGKARLSGDKEEVEKRMTSLKNNNFKRKPVPNNPSPVAKANPSGTSADATQSISPLDFAIVFIKCSIGFFVVCVTLGMILPVLFWSLAVLVAAVSLERAFGGTSESMVLKKLESVIEELNTRWPVIAAWSDKVEARADK